MEEYSEQENTTTENRKSMFDVSKELRQASQVVSRMLIVSKSNPEERNPKMDVAEEMQKWITQNAPSATGLLVFSGSFTIHLVEDSSENLFKLVAFTKSLLELENPPIARASVVAFTEENPDRVLKHWCSVTGNSSSSGEEVPEQVDTAQVSWTLYNNTLQIATRMAKYFRGDQKPSQKELESALKSSSRELLPEQEALAVAVTQHFTSIYDFEEIYLSTLDIVFDSELVWPCPEELSF